MPGLSVYGTQNAFGRQRTFDHSSMSISPTVVSMITRPFVGKAILANAQDTARVEVKCSF